MTADFMGAVPFINPKTVLYVGSVVGGALTSSPTIWTDGEGEIDGELDGEGEAEGEVEGDADGEAEGEGEVFGDGEGDGEPQFP
jgi:hypothetical protein